MADITITPTVNSGISQVVLGDASSDIDTDQAISLMENAKAQGLSVRVELKKSAGRYDAHTGYRISFMVEKKALELADLEDTFLATKQTAKGYIEF